MAVRRFGAVELRDIEAELRGDLFDAFGRFVDEYADLPDVRRDFVDPGLRSARP